MGNDKPILESFEIVKFGPYRFIGRSVYFWAWGPKYHMRSAWEHSDSVFKTLDEMKEYASDDTRNVGFGHWEMFDLGDARQHFKNEMFFGKTELLGYTVGRFMKPDTPVPAGMNYIDIFEIHAAKVFWKEQPGWGLGTPSVAMFDAINGTDDYKPASYLFEADIYPVPDANGVLIYGAYMGVKPLNAEEKAERAQKKKAEAEGANQQ